MAATRFPNMSLAARLVTDKNVLLRVVPNRGSRRMASCTSFARSSCTLALLTLPAVTCGPCQRNADRGVAASALDGHCRALNVTHPHCL